MDIFIKILKFLGLLALIFVGVFVLTAFGWGGIFILVSVAASAFIVFWKK